MARLADARLCISSLNLGHLVHLHEVVFYGLSQVSADHAPSIAHSHCIHCPRLRSLKVQQPKILPDRLDLRSDLSSLRGHSHDADLHRT